MAAMMVHQHSLRPSREEDLGAAAARVPFGMHTADPSSAPSPGGAATIEREHQEQLSEPGDHERFSHYVKKDRIMESALEGGAVVALCGKVWVPSRDPKKFPVCPECQEIYEGLQGGGDGDGESGGRRGGGFFGFGRNR